MLQLIFAKTILRGIIVTFFTNAKIKTAITPNIVYLFKYKREKNNFLMVFYVKMYRNMVTKQHYRFI